MHSGRKLAARLALVLFGAFACATIDATDAYAQSSSCSRLFDTLETLDRNRDFRGLDDNSGEARAIADEVQDAESAYIRTGCNAAAKAGRQLTRECRALARRITSGREDYANLANSVDTGNAVAQQREAVLQEIARFGCKSGSRARVIEEEPDRRNLFDRLFDAMEGGSDFSSEGEFIEDPYGGFGMGGTVRTVCVRKADGYFWPVSYSTLPDYIGNDAQQCQEQCPGAEVELYYYDNPGQEPEQMVSMFGEPYSALPNAFRYKKEFDRTITCKVPTNGGMITVADQGDGRSRAMISFAGGDFPLPMRDPRRAMQVTAATVETAEFVSVPLPRRRPPAPGEAVAAPVEPQVTTTAETRIVQFGDKRVRIVGPETPYAQLGGAGT